MNITKEQVIEYLKKEYSFLTDKLDNWGSPGYDGSYDQVCINTDHVEGIIEYLENKHD